MIKPRRKILNREDVLDILRMEQPFLKEKFGVEKIALFGSFAKGKQTVKSDVDIFVKLGKPLGFEFLDLVDYLEKKINRKVDILTPGGIKGIRVKRIAQDIKQSLVNV